MLYHSTLGFPATLKIPVQTIRLSYTNHAIKASKNDRYGKIVLPKSVKIEKSVIVEVETFDNMEADKVVLRMPHCDKYDLVIVVILKSHEVKTLWLNDNKDIHSTLKINKYNLVC